LAVVPPIAPNTGGAPLTVKDRRALEAQLLFAATVIAPAEYTLEYRTVIVFDPCPLTKVALAGTVQVYEMAPLTAATEYVAGVAVIVQAFATGPEITPGVAGLFVTENVLAALMQEELDAVTEAVPEVKVPPKDTLTILVPEPEVIVIPVGKVQV
jgi:hypothetical protein